jgi:hypothetical protein
VFYYECKGYRERPDERTRTADLISLRVVSQELQGVQRGAEPAFLGRYLFSGLPHVAPYCVRSGVRVVSILSS